MGVSKIQKIKKMRFFCEDYESKLKNWNLALCDPKKSKKLLKFGIFLLKLKYFRNEGVSQLAQVSGHALVSLEHTCCGFKKSYNLVADINGFMWRAKPEISSFWLFLTLFDDFQGKVGKN